MIDILCLIKIWLLNMLKFPGFLYKIFNFEVFFCLNCQIPDKMATLLLFWLTNLSQAVTQNKKFRPISFTLNFGNTFWVLFHIKKRTMVSLPTKLCVGRPLGGNKNRKRKVCGFKRQTITLKKLWAVTRNLSIVEPVYLIKFCLKKSVVMIKSLKFWFSLLIKSFW